MFSCTEGVLCPIWDICQTDGTPIADYTKITDYTLELCPHSKTMPYVYKSLISSTVQATLPNCLMYIEILELLDLDNVPKYNLFWAEALTIHSDENVLDLIYCEHFRHFTTL